MCVEAVPIKISVQDDVEAVATKINAELQKGAYVGHVLLAASSSYGESQPLIIFREC